MIPNACFKNRRTNTLSPPAPPAQMEGGGRVERRWRRRWWWAFKKKTEFCTGRGGWGWGGSRTALPASWIFRSPWLGLHQSTRPRQSVAYRLPCLLMAVGRSQGLNWQWEGSGWGGSCNKGEGRYSEGSKNGMRLLCGATLRGNMKSAVHPLL